MTNEEFTEEIYYEAFAKGYIDVLRKEIERTDSNLPYSDRVHTAYYSLKNRGEIV
jgi:hypothetical protein